MSSGPPLFYIYVKEIVGNTTYIGVFASRAFADRWLAELRSSGNVKLIKSIKRISSQFYTQQHAGDVEATLTVMPKYRDKVFFMLANGVGLSSPGGLVPPDRTRDVISGETYLIRNKTDPRWYWACTPTGAVTCSRTQRSFFRVSTSPNTTASRPGIGFTEYDTLFLQDVQSGKYIRLGEAVPNRYMARLLLADEGSGPGPLDEGMVGPGSRFSLGQFTGGIDRLGFSMWLLNSGKDSTGERVVMGSVPHSPGEGLCWELL
ncbi:hypothetical protein EIP91_004029 [Steccherinum ochraceum]|uniref:Uncharacterized protein n=1 Tax=Steccherinum ochraceum TaxID=92696 RepID=A0A4R0R9K1_9APHY|nr:hypothetical protein EIP91_004029 [Steccherinum ochraceum]